jgi:hypothetical protein
VTGALVNTRAVRGGRDRVLVVLSMSLLGVVAIFPGAVFADDSCFELPPV